MKKIIPAVFVLCLLMMLVGCEKSRVSDQPVIEEVIVNAQSAVSTETYVPTFLPATPAPTEAASPTPEPFVCIGGEQVVLSTEAVVLTDPSEFPLLEKFSSLIQVDTSAFILEMEEFLSLRKSYSQAHFISRILLYGQEVGPETEYLDIHGVKIESPAELLAVLDCFPNLTKADMRGCGLSNDQMETLVNAYPQIKFVWEVKMGTHTLRTDAVGFSTKNPGKYIGPNSSEEYAKKVKNCVRLEDEDIEVLKYCTDLVALDLGHNYISDISVLRYLPKLQILILADNKLTDISVFRELPELVYVEFFMNDVTDITPLEGHDKLLDLNFCNNNVSDLSILESLSQLERVWCAGNAFTRNEGKALQQALPDAKVNYSARDDTADGWREHPRYKWMREYFASNSKYNPA